MWPWYNNEFGTKSETAIWSIKSSFNVFGNGIGIGVNGVPPRPFNEISPLLSISKPRIETRGSLIIV